MCIEDVPSNCLFRTISAHITNLSADIALEVDQNIEVLLFLKKQVGVKSGRMQFTFKDHSYNRICLIYKHLLANHFDTALVFKVIPIVLDV